MYYYITLFTVNGRKIEKNNSANSTHNMLTIYTIVYTIANRKNNGTGMNYDTVQEIYSDVSLIFHSQVVYQSILDSLY